MRLRLSAISLLLVESLASSCAPNSTTVVADRELPSSLRQTGSRVGIDYVSDWVVLEQEAFGRVTDVDLSLGRTRVVGTWGALIAGNPGAPLTWVRFQRPDARTTPSDVQSLDGGSSSRVAYLDRGGSWHPVTFFDADGSALWRSDDHPAVNRLAAGDLDGDGGVDLVAGFNGSGGIERLTETGERVWREPGRNVWAVELADLDRDGRAEILHSRAEGDLVVRDRSGRVLATHRLGDYLGPFAIEGDPRGGPAAPTIVFGSRDGIRLVELSTRGETVLASAHDLSLAQLRAVKVRIEPGGAKVRAVLANFSPFHRSVLSIYDVHGSLLHETVLPFSCSFLTADTLDPEGDVLALGCENRVVLFGRGIPMYRRALAIRTAFYGLEHIGTAEDERVLAWAFYAGDRLAEAEPHARHALELVEQQYGKDAPETAGFLETLGLVVEARDRNEAERFFLRALALSEPPQAPNHVDRWAFHFDLAALYHASARSELAEHHYAAALDALPDRDLSTSRTRARIAYGLAQLLHSQGRGADAARAIDVAIEHDARAYGDAHPNVARDRSLQERIRAAAGAAAPASIDAK